MQQNMATYGNWSKKIHNAASTLININTQVKATVYKAQDKSLQGLEYFFREGGILIIFSKFSFHYPSLTFS